MKVTSQRPAPRAARPVAIHNGYHGLRFSRAAIASMIHALDAHASLFTPHTSSRTSRASRLAPPSPHDGCPPGDISLAFLTDVALAGIHGAFLNNPATTDVITFEGEPAYGTAGEICVSVDTARTYARKHGSDFSTELTLYLVHGWLHLAGYDDLQPAEKRRMRAAEKRAMALLAALGAMPRFLIDKS
ncbi:MAG: rRNA maturation RNase YbeY [Opitutaceae bacterium]|nr:rRNA maturation RNase YbeY [Opitutaceae bacterium]